MVTTRRRDIERARAILPRAADVLTPIVLSEPDQADIVLYRGDTGRFRVNVTDASGAPVDVSSATWDCDVRATVDATTPLTSFTVFPDESPYSVTVEVTAAQSALITADAVWDLEMRIGTDIITVLAGKVLLTKDVSRP